jgi:hypothetical protein
LTGRTAIADVDGSLLIGGALDTLAKSPAGQEQQPQDQHRGQESSSQVHGFSTSGYRLEQSPKQLPGITPP